MPFILRIGSFNINHGLQYYPKKRSKIAEIIKKESYDIVALQEVSREDAIIEICQILGDSCWAYELSRPLETYGRAFLWNTQRVRALATPTVDTDLHFQYDEDHRRFSRKPMFARFTPTGLGAPAFELRLINVHLEPDDTDQKNGEFRTLVREVYPKFQHEIYGSELYRYAPFSFVLGDYNLLRKQCIKLSLPENPLFITDQSTPTTLNTNDVRHLYSSKDVDHFSYDSRSLSGFGILIERVDAVAKYSDGCFEDYFKYISDHVPITLQLTY